MLSCVEPTSPEPIQVYCTRIFHGTEEILWSRMSERPSSAILFERIVEQLSAHNGFTHDVQSGCRLSVSIVSKLINAFRVGHNRRHLRFVALHVIYNVSCWTATNREFTIPFFFCEVFAKGVQSFVHPSPLTLVAVDNHREEVVSHFVNDHRQHSCFCSFAIRSVCFRSSAVETDHRVFHANPFRVNANGNGIRIVYGVSAV